MHTKMTGNHAREKFCKQYQNQAMLLINMRRVSLKMAKWWAIWSEDKLDATDQHSSCSVVIKADKAVNFGDGEGMQVPCKLILAGQEKFVNILKKELECLENWALCNCTQHLKNSQPKRNREHTVCICTDIPMDTCLLHCNTVFFFVAAKTPHPVWLLWAVNNCEIRDLFVALIKIKLLQSLF